MRLAKHFDFTIFPTRLAYLSGDNSGQYVCSGWNRAGEASEFLTITVEEPMDKNVLYLSVGNYNLKLNDDWLFVRFDIFLIPE